MQEMRDVTDRFHITDIDSNELTQHLVSVFHHCTFSALDRIDIPDAESPKVQLFFGSTGQIRKIVTSLSEDELLPVVSELEDRFLSPTHKMIQRFIGFAASPVIGTWECEAFTITAAPPEAPRPQQFLADHPYILEVPFDATDDSLVNIHRANRLRARYELLLSLFVSGIKTTRNTLNMIWGIDTERPREGEPIPHMVQEFYNIPGFNSIVDKRTPLADPLIQLIPDSEYYSWRGYEADYSALDLPRSLQAWINTALNCDDRLSKQLLRAAYWLRHAHEVFGLSQSASLVAAVQAIEVLLPAVKGKVCPTCEREIGPGPTRKFRDFLQRYAPTTDKEERKARDLLYRQRSQLTHGRDLLASDGDPYFGWTNPAHAFDRRTLDGALKLARISTINWFVAQTSLAPATSENAG